MCYNISFQKGDIVCAEYEKYSYFYKNYDLASRIVIVQSESEKYLFVDCLMEDGTDYVFVNNSENKIALRKEDYTTMRLATEKEKTGYLKPLQRRVLSLIV